MTFIVISASKFWSRINHSIDCDRGKYRSRARAVATARFDPSASGFAGGLQRSLPSTSQTAGCRSYPSNRHGFTGGDVAVSFHTWSKDQINTLETTHPVGSRERLALALGLYTGQRRGDVIHRAANCRAVAASKYMAALPNMPTSRLPTIRPSMSAPAIE
jgi:hypothetical protein